MVRVATIPMHRTLFDAIGKSQLRLAEAQQQMATGKKATTFAALGSEAVRTLSTHSLLARQEAEKIVATRLQSTLALVDAHLASTEIAADTLRTQLLKAIGEGRTDGLQGKIEESFQAFRVAMNADEGGAPLFAGAQSGLPFNATALADTVGMTTADAFANDQVKASARLADGLDVTYGVLASDAGGAIFEAFRTLAESGSFDNTPTAAQTAAMQAGVDRLNAGLKEVRNQLTANGQRQAQAETLADRAGQRSLILQDILAQNEDADMAQVAGELKLRQTALEASYAVFARLSGLSLVNYLPN